MGFFDAIAGRRRQVGPTLDPLFALPAASITLQTAAGFTPIGTAAVCYRAAEGEPFDQVEEEIVALLGQRAPQRSIDSYGYSWLVLRDEELVAASEAARANPAEAIDLDPGRLVNDLHTVTTTLQTYGFGPSLLCDVIGFTEAEGRTVALVFLIKQGTFYPFAPVAGEANARDTALELQIRAVVGDELPIERDLRRWFPIWSAPGL
jgi:hypothetical protein